MIVGVDEAGRGPLAGVVVACALYLKSYDHPDIRDSKELSAHKREEVFQWLGDNSIYSVGVAAPEEIDSLNILKATFLAFNRAIIGLLQKDNSLKRAEFIVDGNLFETNLDINYRCLKKADKTVKEVGAASIVAKVSRDYLMDTADFLYPDWQFAKHKGYGTKEHMSAIERYSISPLHRRSFAPCQKNNLQG